MNELELLREIFKSTDLHIGVGTITQLGISQSKAVLRVMVNLLPENRQVVAQMTFADVYSVTFPEINDLAIVLFSDGHPDNAWGVKVCNSKEEPIPLFATTGNTMISPRLGKLVGVGRATVTPTEPFVLGNVLLSGLTNLIARLDATLSRLQSGVICWGSLGDLSYPHPLFISDISAIQEDLADMKEQYIDTASTNILSQIAFTERGA